MICELPCAKLTGEGAASLRALFADPGFGLQPASILSGISRGRVLVDTPDQPSRALIWDQLSSLYLAGEPGDAAFEAAAQDWLAREVIPSAEEIGIPALDIHAHPPAWSERLTALFAPYPIRPLRRMRFRFRAPRPERPIPPAYTLHGIDAALLARRELPGMDWLHGWILSFWHTLDAFVERGIGFCLLHQNAGVVSLCLSVFLSGDAYEFGTGTAEAHRRRGLATAAAAACVRACVARQLTPVWTCDADNLASVAVACKVGFEPTGDYVIGQVPLQTHRGAAA